MERKQILQYDTIRVRLYPSEEQKELFRKTFDCCRCIWNKMLEDQQEFYAATDLHFIPTPAKYKKEFPFLAEVDNQALIQEHGHLSRAFRLFFKDPKNFGYPHFKSKKNDKDSFTACNHVFSSGPTIYLTRDGIRMTKAGVVKAELHRRPQSGWMLRRITVERSKTDCYYCSILFAHPVKEPMPVIPEEETTIGIKNSLVHFYVTDQGVQADPPAWMKQSRSKLQKLQKQLSRMQPESQNYQKTLQKYRQLHEHIANQRRDYLHKTSRQIANEWDGVCMREDSFREMAGNITYGNPNEMAFGTFREMLRYKLERQGKPLILLNRFTPTAKTCCSCGCLYEGTLTLKQKNWTCPQCGALNHREVNGARNIKSTGLASYREQIKK